MGNLWPALGAFVRGNARRITREIIFLLRRKRELLGVTQATLVLMKFQFIVLIRQ